MYLYIYHYIYSWLSICLTRNSSLLGARSPAGPNVRLRLFGFLLHTYNFSIDLYLSVHLLLYVYSCFFYMTSTKFVSFRSTESHWSLRTSSAPLTCTSHIASLTIYISITLYLWLAFHTSITKCVPFRNTESRWSLRASSAPLTCTSHMQFPYMSMSICIYITLIYGWLSICLAPNSSLLGARSAAGPYVRLRLLWPLLHLAPVARPAQGAR